MMPGAVQSPLPFPRCLTGPAAREQALVLTSNSAGQHCSIKLAR